MNEKKVFQELSTPVLKTSAPNTSHDMLCLASTKMKVVFDPSRSQP